MRSQNLNLYLTSEHECGYLPDQIATNLVPDPCVQMNMHLYSQLIEMGYRRSGSHTYKPHCKSCTRCIPCRVPVARFRPNRSQKRCSKMNSHCSARQIPARFLDEHFRLYRKYIDARHAHGNMANPSPQDYESFLYSDWSDTFFIELREDSRLIAVAVCDLVESGLSAVYSYFEPEMKNRSLGTFAVLKMIEQASEMELDYLYLGYMIHGCEKMSYKQNFRPLEVLVDNQWHDHLYSIQTATP